MQTEFTLKEDGTQEWRMNGRLHRDNDQPAVIYPDGTQEWISNGRLHRDDDQPAYIDPREHKNGGGMENVTVMVIFPQSYAPMVPWNGGLTMFGKKVEN